MKLLGLLYGKKLGSHEVLITEALTAAQEAGAEVSMIRLLDLDIKACTGCIACAFSLQQGGSGDCVVKDDLSFLDEHIMECDALILAAPVYVLGPPGLVKTIADRRGPSHDVAWRMEAKKIRETAGKKPAKGPDERTFKRRVAGFITCGGATTPHWLSLALPLMHLFTFPSDIKVVDQMLVMGISQCLHVVMKPERIERARKLGRNVVEAIGTPAERLRWMGDEQGTCPVCHCDLLTVKNKNPVECPVCGISGTLKVEGDKITVTFSEDEQRRSRLMLAGKKEHWDEVTGNTKSFIESGRVGEVDQRLEKYQSCQIPTMAPSRE